MYLFLHQLESGLDQLIPDCEKLFCSELGCVKSNMADLNYVGFPVTTSVGRAFYIFLAVLRELFLTASRLDVGYCPLPILKLCLMFSLALWTMALSDRVLRLMT
uniref:Uncharacterized protein n=1 Tax=Acrobeloides nanus TaxID=290746 RepID=A0A914CQR4_9BILA